MAASTFCSPGALDRSLTPTTTTTTTTPLPVPEEAAALSKMIGIGMARNSTAKTWSEFVSSMFIGLEVVLYIGNSHLIPVGRICKMAEGLVDTSSPVMMISSHIVCNWIRPNRTVREGPAGFTICDDPKSLRWDALAISDLDKFDTYFHTEPEFSSLEPQWLLATPDPTRFVQFKEMFKFLMESAPASAHPSAVTHSLTAIRDIAARWNPRPWPDNAQHPQPPRLQPELIPMPMPAPIPSIDIHPFFRALAAEKRHRPITIAGRRVFAIYSKSSTAPWKCRECAELAAKRAGFTPGFKIHLEDMRILLDYWTELEGAGGASEKREHFLLHYYTRGCLFHLDPTTLTGPPSQEACPPPPKGLLKIAFSQWCNLILADMSDLVTTTMASVQNSHCLVRENGDLEAQQLLVKCQAQCRQVETFFA